VKRFEFRPRLLPVVAGLLLLPLLVGLGLWQLERAEDKRKLVAQWQAAQEQEPVPLVQARRGGAGRFTPVTVRGRYDARHQFLLDNRIRDNRPGFHVLTPLRLAGREQAVLVNRGWVPLGRSRQELPALPTPEGEVRVRGGWVPPPATGIRLGPPDTGGSDWPRVVQYVVPERVSRQLGYPVLGRVVRLAPGAAGGFPREWGAEPPVPFGPERHVGYAVQWFALAATLVVIFGVVNWRRRGEAHGDDASARGGSGPV